MKTLNVILGISVVVALATSATASSGTVKWFNPGKGLGFNVSDHGGADLFVHHSYIMFSDLEVGIRQFTFDAAQLSQILALVDSLECQALRELSIVAAEQESSGNMLAATRVRKQMQLIKQAAQQVRNRILEIRSAPGIFLGISAI
jgi:CspA family cold shock protein